MKKIIYLLLMAIVLGVIGGMLEVHNAQVKVEKGGGK